ncbi:hypothetical protein WDU94_002328 [Cyamophila willieti]
MENIYVGICSCLILICSVNGLNHVTTMYEINTVRSDIEDDVKYLNTCTISVHVPKQDSHSPLFNINGNGTIMGTNIPPFFIDEKTNTGWRSPTEDNVTVFNLDMKRYGIKFPFISGSLVQNFKTKKIYEKMSGPVFDETDMALLYNTSALPFNILVVNFVPQMQTRTQLYWDTLNDSHFIEITISNGTNITVCYHNEDIDCKEFGMNIPLKYVPQLHKNIFALYFSLYDELVISNGFSIPFQTLHTNFHLPKGFTRYTKVNHVQIDDCNLPAGYRIYQVANFAYASPWLEMKINTEVLMFYFAQPGHRVNVSLEDATSIKTVELVGIELDRVNTRTGLEIVITKVKIPSWTGKKRIWFDGDTISMINILELEQLKIEGPASCVKSNKMDIIYNNILERGGPSEPIVDSCFNGGRLKNAACACPPGFAGNQCELPCGRNRFGKTCTSKCSKISNQCKGIILCTPDYGCTCAPGYYGDQCIEKCQQGTYGADCTQTCEHCMNGCDRYTGACKREY